MGIVGDAFIAVRPDTSEFASDLKGKIGDALKNPMVIAGAAVAATGAIVTDFAKKSIDKFQEVGAQVKTLTTLTGESPQSMSRLAFAAGETGVPIEALGVGLKKLSLNIASNSAALNKSGIAFKNAKGETLPLDVTLANVAAKFAAMPNGIAKNTLAIQLFGKSGTDLIPILNKGKDGLAQLSAESDKYGLTLTQGNLDALKKNALAHKELNAAMSGLQVQIGALLLPVLASLATGFNDTVLPAITGVTNAIENSAGLKKVLAELADQAGSFFSAVGPVVATFVKDTGTAITSFISGFQTGNTAGDLGLTGIAGAFVDLGNTVKTFATDATNAYNGFIAGFNGGALDQNGGFATAGAVVGTVAHALLDALGALADFVSAHPTLLQDVAGGVLAIIAAYKTAVFTKKTIDFAVSGTKDVLDTIANISGGLAKIGDKVINVAANSAAGQAAKNAAQAAGGGTGSAASNVAQNVVGGAAANALDFKALAPKVATALKTLVTIAIPVFLIDVAEGLAAVGAAIVGSIFFVPALIAAAVVAVAALAYAFRGPLGDFISNIPGWIGDGISALGDFGSYLLDKGIQLITGLLNGMLNAFIDIGTWLNKLPDLIAYLIGFQLGLLYRIGSDIITGLFNGIKYIFEGSKHFFSDLPGNVLNILGDLGHVLFEVGGGLIGGLWTGIHFIWDTNVHFWTDIVPAVLGYLGDLTRTLYQKGLDLLAGIWSGIQDAWRDPVGFFKNFNIAVERLIGDVARTLYQKGRDLISGLLDGIHDVYQSVSRFISGVGDDIGRAIGDASKWLYQAGKDIVQGLLNGITEKYDKVVKTIKNLGGDLVSGFNAAVSNHSPSKLMHNAGVNIGQGLINGIDQMAPKAIEAIANLVGTPSLNLTGVAGSAGHTYVLNNYGPTDANDLMTQFQDMQRLAVPIR